MSTKQVAFMMAALLVAVMTTQLSATMLAPAIREIETKLGTGSFAAMSTYFYLAGAVANVVLIRWSDFIGRKRMLGSVLAVACVGTALCAVTTTLSLVLAGRFLQGVVNVTFGLTFLILRERLSDKTFGLCAGIVTAVSGGTAGLDGLLGGYMSDHLGYRSIFMLIGVVGVVGVVLCVLAVPADDPERVAPGRMDWVGGALIAMGVAGVNLFFSSGTRSGWSSPLALGFIVAAIIALVALVVVEKRTARPLVNIGQLASRQAWPLLVVILLNMGSFMVVLGFIVPFIAEDLDSGFGHNGLTTALLFLTPAASLQLITAPLAGRIAVRIGFVTLLRIGQIGALTATSLLAIFSHNQVLVAVFVALLGLTYLGIAGTAISVLGVTQAPADEPGSLPGIANASFGIGASLGYTWAGFIVGSGTYSSFQLSLWICVGAGAFGLAASLLLRPRTKSTATNPPVPQHG
jgi:MFS family permease